MSGMHMRSVRQFFVPFIAIIVSLSLNVSAAERSSSPPVNAFFLSTVPSDYGALEKLFRSLKDRGANSIMLRPVMERGRISKSVLTNSVFIAHQTGLSIYVILPTRGMESALDEHPEWEDMRFDVERGALQPAGKLDLFNAHVIVYLSDYFKDIAGYSVDGILLDEDFRYSDIEGVSPAGLEKYKKKFGSSFNPWKELSELHDSGLQGTQLYGEGFWDFARLKSDRLVLLLKNIVQASQAANKKIRIGIPLHIPGFSQAKEQLAWFSYDMDDYKKMNIDLYWVAIPHREIRAQQNIGYQKGMEVLSRMVKSAITMMNDPSKMVIVVQTTSASGDILPSSEIEEAIEMVKHAGEPGIAFMINADAVLPAVLTKKTFLRQ